MTVRSAIKYQGKEEGEGLLVVVVFVFPGNHYLC